MKANKMGLEARSVTFHSNINPVLYQFLQFWMPIAEQRRMNDIDITVENAKGEVTRVLVLFH